MGAQDERIAVVFASCSGVESASLGRRDFGLTIDDLTENYPWQHAGNLNKWVGCWNEMPIDSHMLIFYPAAARLLLQRWHDRPMG